MASRKLTEYNRFVADMIKCHGMTMAQAAKAWNGDKRLKKSRSRSRHSKSCRITHKKSPRRKSPIRRRKVGSRSKSYRRSRSR